MAVHQLVTFPYVAGTLSTFGKRERFGPPGVFDGRVGRTAGMALNPDTEREQSLPVFSVLVPVAVGDLLSFWSAGRRRLRPIPWNVTRSAYSTM